MLVFPVELGKNDFGFLFSISILSKVVCAEFVGIWKTKTNGATTVRLMSEIFIY